MSSFMSRVAAAPISWGICEAPGWGLQLPVDRVLAAFYAQHAGKAASMTDMLALIKSMTGYDPAACAETWLKAPATPAAPAACP